VFGHAGQGSVHVRPLLDLRNPTDVDIMGEVSEEVHSFVLSISGTVSAEHGDGLSRTQFVERQYGDIYPLFVEVKRLLDPKNLMNPGKIINSDPELVTRNLRYGEHYRTFPTETILDFSDRSFTEAVELCHGCSQCRTILPAVARMCPVFKATRTRQVCGSNGAEPDEQGAGGISRHAFSAGERCSTTGKLGSADRSHKVSYGNGHRAGSPPGVPGLLG